MLLHGHPRTGATWHRVAPVLAGNGFTVVVPDLRGYGRSTAPAPRADHSQASKRAMAGDVLALMRTLGHERFGLVGHDRGSYAAFRLAMDHPEAVDRVALLDCIPIVEHLDRMTPEFATQWFHWFFSAQQGRARARHRRRPGRLVPRRPGCDGTRELRRAAGRGAPPRGRARDARGLPRRPHRRPRRRGGRPGCGTEAHDAAAGAVVAARRPRAALRRPARHLVRLGGGCARSRNRQQPPCG
ncbi:alpha/beta fold hydrolase [Leifsonia xyli]|uniref:alpha/beta fold hydrolase n=1 Tax=Leifsonia xyli TaxID=1575 RepID=UPI003D66E25B